MSDPSPTSTPESGIPFGPVATLERRLEWAVDWDSTDDGPGGIDPRSDRATAESVRSSHPEWPSRIVCRKVQIAVGPWEPAEAGQ